MLHVEAAMEAKAAAERCEKRHDAQLEALDAARRCWRMLTYADVC
jgi:hypothetical protein